MSYTPEQIAEECAAADSFCATPAKNTLSVRKLRVLAEIVREQVARIADLSGAFIAADKAEQELLTQRERIAALEAEIVILKECHHCRHGYHKHAVDTKRCVNTIERRCQCEEQP